MASAKDLNDEAWKAMASGQYRLAALTAAEAIERARESGDDEAFVLANYRAGEVALGLGDFPKALRHLMESESADRSPPGEMTWRRRVRQFFMILRLRPNCAELAERLDDLRGLSRKFQAPFHDILHLEGKVAWSIGDWQASLRCNSQSYRHKIDNSNSGIVAFESAASCADAAIKLQDFVAAEDWISAVHVEEEVESWGPQIAQRQAELRLHLARSRNSCAGELQTLLQALEDATQAQDTTGARSDLHVARFRVALLDPANGDPDAHWHPARTSCRLAYRSRWDVHSRYNHSLRVLDVRLAALRYACGLDPIDDEFGPQPRRGLSCGADPSVPSRLHRVRAALAVAYRKARGVDQMLGCTWRKETVDRCAEWIEAIAAAIERPEGARHPDAKSQAASST